MKIELNDDFETILLCAERYACSHESYMPSLVINYITPLLPNLSDRALSVLDEDMRVVDEIDRRYKSLEITFENCHGIWGNDHIDKPEWMRFWRAVKAEIGRRKNGRSN